MPAAGETVDATEGWEEAAGGGAVAAVPLGRLAGGATLYTALGNDELGRRARQQLTAQGVTVEAADAKEPQRRAFTLVDGNGERTIVVLGAKLLHPGEEGELPREDL